MNAFAQLDAEDDEGMDEVEQLLGQLNAEELAQLTEMIDSGDLNAMA